MKNSLPEPKQKTLRAILFSLLLFFTAYTVNAQVIAAITANGEDLPDDLRDCVAFNCTAGDINIFDVYLTHLNLDTLDETCTSGEIIDALIVAEIEVGRSDVYDMAFYSDLTIIRNGTIFKEDTLMSFLGPTPTAGVVTYVLDTIQWTCGDEIQLSRIVIPWLQGAIHKKDTFHTCENYTYNKAQCYQPEMAIFVNAPLSASITYEACSYDSVHATFYGDAEGGSKSYSYLWDFGDGTTDVGQTVSHNFELGYSNEIILTVDDGSYTVSDTIVPLFPDSIHVEATVSGVIDCNNTSAFLDGTGSDAGLREWVAPDGTTISTELTASTDSAGIYTFYVTRDGCTDSTTVEVIANYSTAEATITGNQELTCETTSITLDATTADAEYEWSTNETTASIQVTEPGEYSVIVTNTTTGCESYDTVQVVQDITPVVATIAGNDILTCTTTEITIDASGSTAQEPTFVWKLDGTVITDSIANTLVVRAPGSYSVHITDANNGCTDSDTVVVVQDDNVPTAVITADAEMLTCDTTTIVLDAATTDATYLWSNGLTTSSIVITDPGTYSVTVTDISSGCTATDEITIEENTNYPIPVINDNEELTCANTETILDASGSGAVNPAYVWKKDGAVLPGETAATLSVVVPGTYSVHIKDTESGCIDSTSVDVTQDITPVLAKIEGNETLTCKTTEITLDASGSTAQIPTYVWKKDGSILAGETGDTLIVIAPGTYSVHITDTDNGCADSSSVVVAQNIVEPTANITGDDQILTCATLSITLNASTTNAIYLWSNDSTTSNIEVSAPGDYSVIVTDVTNGCSSYDTVTVSQNITKPVPEITDDEELTCTLTEITLDASGTTAVDPAFVWKKDGAVLAGQTGDTLDVDEPGIYSVHVTDLDNGCVDSTEVTITEDLTAPIAQISGNELLTCANAENILDAETIVEGRTFSYQWSTGETTSSITISDPGTYSVTITDNYNGCTDSDEVTVLQDITYPIANITGDDVLLTCDNFSVTLDAEYTEEGRTFSYLWNTSNADTTASVVVTAPGDYSVIITDDLSGCMAYDTVTVSKDEALPTANIRGKELLTCNNTSAVLDAEYTAEGKTFSYLWSNDSTTSGIEVTTPGEYSVIVTDDLTGCQAYDTVDIAQDIIVPTTVISHSGELTCDTTVRTLDAETIVEGKTFSYLWSNAETTSSIDVTEPGDYSVIITDDLTGCMGYDTVTVTQDTVKPVALISGNEILTCNTTEITLDAETIVEGRTFSYLWSNDSTTASIAVTEPGTYSVTITDNYNGCTDSDTVVVVQDKEVPVAEISGAEDLSCGTLSVTLDAEITKEGKTYSYLWSNDSTTSSIEVDETGYYSVTVTDDISGCSSSDTVFIDLNLEQPTVEIIGNEVLTCDNESVVLTAINTDLAGTVTFLWSNGETTPEITVTTRGIYSVIVSNVQSGCMALDTVIVRENTFRPVADAGPDKELNCDMPTVQLIGSDVSLEPDRDFSYEWVTQDGHIAAGADSSTASVDMPGTYVLNITDNENGCSDFDIVVVTADEALPVVVFDVTSEILCNGGTASAAASANEEYTYSWTGPEGFTSDAQSVEGLVAGTYYITTTKENGCTVSDTLVVTEPDALTATAEQDDPAECGVPETGKATVTAEGGVEPYTYLWDNDETTASAVALSVGDHSVTVTDANGCTTTSSVTITDLDRTAPVAVCKDISVELDAEGNVTIFVEDINDNSSDECGIDTMWIEPVDFTCENLGENTVVLTVVDEAGYSATCEATVTVLEGAADCTPLDIQPADDALKLLVCEGEPVTGSLNILDNDSGFDIAEVTITTSELPASVQLNTATGEMIYTSAEGFLGTETFTYQVCDTEHPENCGSAEVVITVVNDNDCDGVDDEIDIDDDDDGILDVDEGNLTVDTDNDGVPDSWDIDSDNDGITDNTEWQSESENYIAPSGNDVNGDGWDDAYDASQGGTYYEAVNTDNTGSPDYLDNDSDDDGIPDSLEGFDANLDSIPDVLPSGSDSDNDGLDDAYDTIDGWGTGSNATGSNQILQDGPQYDCDPITGELIIVGDPDGVRDWRDEDIKPNCNPITPEECDFVIPNGFSPNDDGINDYFWMDFENCPDIESSKIEIYNRWGNLVYEKENYGDEDRWGTTDAWWDGRSNVGWTVGGDRLPPATYFYILYYKGGKEPSAGTIFLNK